MLTRASKICDCELLSTQKKQIEPDISVPRKYRRVYFATKRDLLTVLNTGIFEGLWDGKYDAVNKLSERWQSAQILRQSSSNKYKKKYQNIFLTIYYIIVRTTYFEYNKEA